MAAACRAQVLMDPARFPAAFRDVERVFEPLEDETRLQCEVTPFKPRVDFGFRFQTGYGIRVPLSQYRGPGHRWSVLARVTPEGGKPSYLFTLMRLPDVPPTRVKAEVGGSYLVGEGRYTVDLLLLDEKRRACRKRWSIDARRARSEHEVALRLPAGAVRAVSWRSSPVERHLGERPYRIALLVHAAPVFARSTRLRYYDREMLLGTLGPLLEQIPAQSVHLVLFNLDQQKVLLDSEDFRGEELNRVGQALNGLELGTVNYKVLRNGGGHLALLSRLVNQEIEKPERPDAVIILGPAARAFDKLPPAMLAERSGGDPLFFYVQYRPYMQRGAEFPDCIQNAMKVLKGRTVVVHSPGEFAGALRQVGLRLEERRSAATVARPETSH